MDRRLTDRLARALLARPGRRAVTKGAVGGTVGAALALLGGARPGVGRETCAPPPGKRCPSPEDSFCRATRRCVFSNCAMLGQVYNPCTCQCESP
jgi:hypothetical protein